MNIAGLQKMTLLDFPGRVACTVFLQGCNYRCPFCHNSALIPSTGDVLMDDKELLSFLKKRTGLLDGVCITGGEPTLQKELPQLLGGIKELGYGVKLDTNGGRPQVLKELIDAGLVDYVAMDIKNSPARYGETAGNNTAINKVEESVKILLEDKVDYELRTTVVEELHSGKDIEEMGAWIASLTGRRPKRWFLQRYTDRDSVLQNGLHPPSAESMQQYAEILTPFGESVSLRGVE